MKIRFQFLFNSSNLILDFLLMILEILDPLEDLELIAVEFARFWNVFFPGKVAGPDSVFSSGLSRSSVGCSVPFKPSARFQFTGLNPGNFLTIPSSWWRPIRPGLEDFRPAIPLLCFGRNFLFLPNYSEFIRLFVRS